MIKKIPLAMAGLILGIFGLGNLLTSYGEIYRTICGGIGIVLYILYIARLMIYRENIGEELKNPMVATVFATFPMASMLLGAFLYSFSKNIGFYFWVFGVALHGLLIIWFTMTVAIKKDIKTVFPTWFIMFVGIVVASVTGKMFGMVVIAQRCFWFGLIAYLILIPIVCYRVFVFKNIPEPALASLVVFTAPGGLLLAGYANAFETKQMAIVLGLMILSAIFYLLALSQLPRVMKLPFYPSLSAITFPTVITGLGFKLTNAYFVKIEKPIIWLPYVVKAMELVAVVCVVFALLGYLKFLLGTTSAPAKTVSKG